MHEERFAEIYDVLHAGKNYARESAYVLETIAKFAPAARTMLEVACGTGLFLQIFSDRFDVEGRDASAAMLARAARRVPGVALHERDMTSFSTGKQYDVVCCLFRSIANVGTRDRFRGAIDCFARHVRPGGIVVIEPHFSPDTFWDGHVGFNQYDSPGLKAAWMHLQQRVGADHFRYRHHFLVGSAGNVDHFTEVHDLVLLSKADYERAFSDCGLALHHDPVGPTGGGLYVGVRER